MPADKNWSRTDIIGSLTLIVAVLSLIVAFYMGYIQLPNSNNDKEIDLNCTISKPITILDENSKVEGIF